MGVEMTEPTLRERAEAVISNLTSDEVAVIEAAAAGTDCAFPTMVPVRPIVLRWMCCDPDAKALIHPRGVRIENARICGPLDLTNITIEFLLRVHNCIVEGDITLTDSRLRSFGFNGTTCQKLIAERSVVAGSAYLSHDVRGPFNCTVLSFCDASIDDNLVADQARIGPAQDDSDALFIDRSRIRGYVYLHRARIDGSLCARDAQVGALDISDMWVSANPRRGDAGAVELDGSTITGSLRGMRVTADGPIMMRGSVVGGGVDFTSAQIMPTPKLNQPPSTTEDTAAEDDQPAITEAPAEELDAGVLPVLVDIQLTRIGFHLVLEKMIVTDGRVLIWDVDIRKDLNCLGLDLIRLGDDEDHDQGAKDKQSLKSPAKRESLNPENLQPDIAILSTKIGGTLGWEPLRLENRIVVLSRTTTERLNITSVTYWPSRGRLWLDGLQYQYIYGDVLYRRPALAEPARRLKKDQQSGSMSLMRRLQLRLAYAIAGGDWTHLRWLRLYTRKYYDPQPYSTLAAALRSMGRENDATRVLIARADDRRRAQGLMAFLLGIPYRLLVGNGFRTWWAAIWIIVVTLVGTVVFNRAYDQGELTRVTPAAQTMPFQPFVYSLDVLLPIVNLGQADSYVPTGPQASGVRTYLWTQEGLGWLLATALVASAGATLRRSGT